MHEKPGILYNRRVLVVHNGTNGERAEGRATATLIEELRDRNIEVFEAASLIEAEAQLNMHSLLQVIVSSDSGNLRGVPRITIL